MKPTQHITPAILKTLLTFSPKAETGPGLLRRALALSCSAIRRMAGIVQDYESKLDDFVRDR